MGWFDQVIWNLSEFQGFYSSFAANHTHLAHHFQPILFFLVPIYWIFDNVRVLFFIEPLVYALGSLPIFWFARDFLKNQFLALGFAISYLLFIGSQYALSYTFHPEIFAITFIAFAFYFLYRKKYIWHFLFIVLALMSKENISLYIIFISIFGMFLGMNKKVLLADILISIVWLLVCIKLIIPSFNQDQYMFLNFADFGENLFEIGTNMIFKPLHTLNVFF